MMDDDATACTILSTRVIDAPREKVFAAYENIDSLARWWGPDGFSQTVECFDFRPGGDWKFMFHGPGGKDYPNHQVWREIEKPSRIVVEHVSNPHYVMTMTLEDLGGKTRLTWHQRFDSPKVRDGLAPVCVPANEQNFDRLEAELKRT
jgi:uncharacterized protein YndB with AHSA1/START domain